MVYAGSGVRGYGKLILLKHNDQYLSAYAHNDTLRVKENDVVRAGEVIATMGDSDARMSGCISRFARMASLRIPWSICPHVEWRVQRASPESLSERHTIITSGIDRDQHDERCPAATMG